MPQMRRNGIVIDDDRLLGRSSRFVTDLYGIVCPLCP